MGSASLHSANQQKIRHTWHNQVKHRPMALLSLYESLLSESVSQSTWYTRPSRLGAAFSGEAYGKMADAFIFAVDAK